MLERRSLLKGLLGFLTLGKFLNREEQTKKNVSMSWTIYPFAKQGVIEIKWEPQTEEEFHQAVAAVRKLFYFKQGFNK